MLKKTVASMEMGGRLTTGGKNVNYFSWILVNKLYFSLQGIHCWPTMCRIKGFPKFHIQVREFLWFSIIFLLTHDTFSIFFFFV